MDEEKFTLDTEMNPSNSFVISYNSSNIPHVFKTKNPAFMIVFGSVASDGSVMNPHYIAAGLENGSKEYLDIFKTYLLQWMQQNFGLDKM